MEMLLYLVIVYACGLVTGYALHLYMKRLVVAPVPAGVAPAGGTAVLVNAAGEDVSRRTLQRDESRIQRPHGKGRAETFVYVGLRSDGCHEFRSVR
jgi:hypothetical protein